MLELYFKYPRVLRRLRSGALGQEMDRIAAHFSELGYKRGSAKVYISRLAKFSEFAARSAGGATIEQDVIDRFVQSLRTATPRIAARTAIEHARRLAPGETKDQQSASVSVLCAAGRSVQIQRRHFEDCALSTGAKRD